MRLGKTKQHEEKGKLANDILAVHALLVRVIHGSPSQALCMNKHQSDALWRIFAGTESDGIALCRDTLMRPLSESR